MRWDNYQCMCPPPLFQQVRTTVVTSSKLNNIAETMINNVIVQHYASATIAA